MCDGFKDCLDNSDEECTTKRNITRTTTTTTKTPKVCESDIYCDSGLKCLLKGRVCDGVRDCADWSDEINCTCSSDQHQCSKGPCIQHSWVCDGTKDCPQGDDEGPRACTTCGLDDFKCFKKQQCIKSFRRCDGFNDCDDSSDEVGCFYMHQDTIKATFRGVENHSICYNSMPRKLLPQLVTQVCSSLGFDSYSWYMQKPLMANETTISYKLPYLTALDHTFMQHFKQEECVSHEKISVQCSPRNCGKRNSSFETKDSYVINGHHSRLGQWPWQALVHTGQRFVCGASIITNKWLVTAAHCLENLTVAYISVAVGVVDMNKAIWLKVERVEMFKKEVLNDIALIKLEEELVFNDTVQPICMEDSEQFNERASTYEVCVASGFGDTRTKPFRDSDVFLLHGKKVLMSAEKCVNMVKKAYNNENFHEATKLCAGDEPHMIQPFTCHGDSGGPLACRDGTGRWTLVGVTSYGDTYCANNVYTKVSGYHQHLMKVVLQDSLRCF